MKQAHGKIKICLFVTSALLTACAHSPKDEAISIEGPVELMLSREEGRREKVRFLNRTRIRSFEDGQIVHQQEAETAFTVNTEIVKVELDGDMSGEAPQREAEREAETESAPKGERLIERITTSDKIGAMDLQALALPEPGESLSLTLSRRGTVLKAGNYPQGTVFYIPPVSLPAGPVEIGDTWVLKTNWYSMENNLPFTLDSVSILKRFIPCGSDECAEIEVSGEVRIHSGTSASLAALNFKSVIQGTVLFARKAGTVVWSRIDSLETLDADNVSRRVYSCLESVLVEPNIPSATQTPAPQCDAAAIPAALTDAG